MYHSDGTIYDPNTIARTPTQPVGAGPFVLKSYQRGVLHQARRQPQVLEQGPVLGSAESISSRPRTVRRSSRHSRPVPSTWRTSSRTRSAAVKAPIQPRRGRGQVLRLCRPADATERGALQQPEGPRRVGICGRPQRPQPGGRRRPRRAGLPTIPVVVPWLQQGGREQVHLSAGEGQGHAEGRRLPQGDLVHARRAERRSLVRPSLPAHPAAGEGRRVHRHPASRSTPPTS